MARGRSSRGQREASDFASIEELLAPVTFPAIYVTSVPSFQWQEIEDRRVFDPEQAYRPALSFSGNQAPANRIPRVDRSWSTIGFNEPSRVVICARRHRRREVLFAKKRHRRGRGGSRRRNYWSNIRC